MKTLAFLGYQGLGAALAQASDGGIGDFAILFNYGVLGVVTLLWLTGRIETPKRGDRAEERATAAEARERELQDVLRHEVVPALVRFTETGSRILDRDGRG
jgi:hypothetical protein